MKRGRNRKRPVPGPPGSGVPDSPRSAVSRREVFLGLALLVVVLAVAYRNIVFGGQTLVATSNYHPFDDRWDHLRAGGLNAPAYLNWYDPGASWWQWEPAGQFFGRAYRQGILPLWDPTIAGGVDAHVNVTQGQYFPPYVLLLLSGNTPLARDAYHLLLILGSGACCFALFRRNGLHGVSATAAGTAFMLTGALTFNANSIVGQAVAVIPLLALAGDALVDHPTWPRAAVLALAVAFAISASFLPVVLSGLLLLPFLLLARWAVPEPSEGRPRPQALTASVRMLSGGALGLAMAAFLLLPIHLASRLDPNFRAWYAGLGLQHFRPDVLLTIVSPMLTYSVAQAADPKSVPFPLPYDWVAAFFYVGALPLLLSAFAWSDPRPRVRRLRIVFFGAGAFILLKLLGVPPIQWIGHLPVLNQIHFIPYFCGALGFCVAGIAGLGVEGLVRNRPSRSALIGFAAAGAALALLVIGFWSTHKPAASGMPHVRELVRLGLLAIGLLGVAWLRHRARLTGGVAGALALAGIVLELAPLAYRPRFLRHDIWNDPPAYVRTLQADPALFRVHGAGDMGLTGNVAQGLGLQALSSRHAFNAPRYDTFFRHYFGNRESHFLLAAGLLPTRRSVLDLLGVKYLVTHGISPAVESSLVTQGFELAGRDERFAQWRNTTVWPRAYVASRYRLARSPEDALVAAGELGRPDEVVLEQAPAAARPQAETSEPAGQADVIRYGPNLVRVRARSPGPAVLVLSDVLAPGWRATVNGRPEPVLAANYAFRGVEIPGGESVVEFRYRTPGLRTGLIVSAGAAAAVAALLIGARRRRPAAGPGPGLAG